MTMLKIILDNRDYSSWTIVNATTFLPITNLENEMNVFNPLQHKLFNNDIFTFNKNKVNIIHSSQRDNDCIAGVLILSENKTYGKIKNKFLYRCIPDDIRIPSFLIPYEMKNVGFSKMFVNLYITFRFTQWDDKHPLGTIQHVIGSVDVLENFYEYQLYCKSLNTSIQRFHKNTQKFLQQKSEDHDNIINLIHNDYPHLESRTDINIWNIFSIDPVNSVDFDDAFSIKTINENKCMISIYISNVTIWMEYLQLWDSFSRRISTIYLPDKKRPMLPTILSDCLCSLQERKKRFAFVLDIIIEEDIVRSFHFTNCIIQVNKNYTYEEPALLKMKDYLSLLNYTKQLSKNYKYLKKINDSHDVVSYFMILMNHYSARDLMRFKNGIFRSATLKQTNQNQTILPPNNLPDEVAQFITIWSSFSGQYVDISKVEDNVETKPENENVSIRHELLNIDAYIHITSPIRRLVDLLNMIQIQQNNNMITLSKEALEFYSKWLKEIDYINVTMRSIRKVQNDCTLLDLCSKDPEIMKKTYDGYCFDKIVRNDGLYQFVVYLPEIKLTSRIIIRENLNNYEKHTFSLFLFHNEAKFKKKIRMQLVE